MNECNPRYLISFWNCYDRVLLNLPKTINSLEAWHRGLNFKCNVPHLNLLKFIEVLIFENERVRINYYQQRKNLDLNVSKITRDNSLQNICINFNFFDLNEYFENINKFYYWNFN